MKDLLYLDEHFTDEEKIIRDTVKSFVKAEVEPLMADAFLQGTFPTVLIKKLSNLGVLGMTLPAEYGGSGASATAYGIVCQELEYGDSSVRSFVSVQSSLCMYPIYEYGTEEQKQQYLKEMAEGKIIGCFGLTEPDSGSDPANMKTTAKKVDGGWVINGSKMWITNATIADIAIVWAKTDDGIRGFIVPKETKGFSATEIDKKMSLRASITGSLFFEDCFVADDNVLPGTTKGLVSALNCLTQARFGIAWGAIGAAEACFNSAVAFCKERKQFNGTLATKQLVQHELATMYKEILKAKTLNLHLAQLKTDGKLDHVLVSVAKMNSCKEALAIARAARNLLGANGISLEYPVIRHMLNLESVFTYEGTDAIHQLIIGRFITEEGAF